MNTVKQLVCWLVGHKPNPLPAVQMSVDGKAHGSLHQCERCLALLNGPE